MVQRSIIVIPTRNDLVAKRGALFTGAVRNKNP